eukprot:10948850-Lingulodinium_polyedra.AAC.1
MPGGSAPGPCRCWRCDRISPMLPNLAPGCVRAPCSSSPHLCTPWVMSFMRNCPTGERWMRCSCACPAM